MKIAVVMSVYNRQALFDRTLQTIARSKASHVELIVCDDASDTELLTPDPYRYPIYALRTDPLRKFWTSVPVVPFNQGIQWALDLGAEVIVLQSPECLHVGDVLAHVEKYCRRGLYLTFACFAADEEQTRDWSYPFGLAANSQDYARETHSGGPPGWFNHPVHRPAHLEFCAAIHRDDLRTLNGYDERFADGVACGDCDLLQRIQNLGLQLAITDPETDPFVVHQWHYNGPNPYDDVPRYLRNQDMLLRLEEKESKRYRAVHLFTEDLE